MRRIRLAAATVIAAAVAVIVIALPAASAGVHKYNTRVSIFREGGPTGADRSACDPERKCVFWHGHVKSGARKCMKGRRVILFKKRPGADRKLGADRAHVQGGDGDWGLNAPAVNRAYAKVNRKVRDGYVCRADRSETISWYGTGPKMQRHLDKVKAATKRYKDVGVALRDGYLASDHCEEKPGVGAMGYHYINPQFFGDRRIRPLHPEELLYLPTRSGGRRLGGVEYARADADQDLSTDSDRPDFYGRRFDGPMAGHFPGQPIHYDLHVWLFQDNPKGVFARYNPKASC